MAFGLVPVISIAQIANPPVEQPLLREGTLAVRMVEALNLGSTTDEVEAESLLSSVGIMPRNGWIADYPVTPDIIGELKASLTEAADSARITVGKEEALKAFDDVLKTYGVAVAPDTSGREGESASVGSSDSTVINNYYYDYGPPVVTYYAPPPAYSYLYTWVPYPFWWWDWWFPGFYVLVDFHRVVFIDRHAVFVSNHVFDHRRKGFFRVDPLNRFHGRTFIGRDGIGRDRRVFGPSAVRHDPRRIFAPSSGSLRKPGPASRDGSVVSPLNRGTNTGVSRSVTPSRREGTPGISRGVTPSRREGTVWQNRDRSPRTSISPRDFGTSTGISRTVRPSGNAGAFLQNRGATQSSAGAFRAPSGGGRTFSPSAPRASSPSFGGSRGSFGGGRGR